MFEHEYHLVCIAVLILRSKGPCFQCAMGKKYKMNVAQALIFITFAGTGRSGNTYLTYFPPLRLCQIIVLDCVPSF